MLLAGEMYLDDLLLFGGDFQLAQAGGLHHEASSEHGVLLAVHGDLDLDVGVGDEVLVPARMIRGAPL